MIFRESPWGKTRHLIKAWSMEGKKKKRKNKQTTTPLGMAYEQALRAPRTPCKGIWIPESGNFLLVESGMRELFACGIRNLGPRNPNYSSRNQESH